MPSIHSRAYAVLMRALMKRDIPNEVHPQSIRSRLDKLAAQHVRAPRMVRIHPAVLGPSEIVPTALRAERFVPAGNAPFEPVILYLHGGGYVVCSPRTHRALVGRLCLAAGASALVLDYRKAPESPFPAALNDAVAAYRWLLAQDIAPGRIVIAGDSAGGGLSMSLMVRLRDLDLPMPAGAIGMSPWTDLAMTGDSVLDNARSDAFLTPASMQWAAGHYLQATDAAHPLASPLYADLTDLSPLYVTASTTEMLRDDAIRFVHRAQNHSVDAEIHLHPGLMHVFQVFVGTPEARRSVSDMADFIHRVTAR